ncbi:MAG: DUF4038 domain-containing protein [Ardenticatenaceae bacterium]|nr:DUF4038 domain-containing protein [Ardenticatenaceae bacterium]
MLIHPWQEIEIVLTAALEYENPYTDVDVHVEFTHESGTTLRRPAFWDGGQTWKVRFASPLANGRWHWLSQSSHKDSGLHRQGGTLDCQPDSQTTHRFYRHGFWRMSPGKRSLVHADGYPAILAGDTAWALPWRATEEQCRIYAVDRQAKGFNAVLLMSVQPDMHARGPRDRIADEGFDIGFEDLPNGHINELNPAYFQYLDRLIGILVEHEIVPVYQPVFFGFGWKGLSVAGPVLPPAEYARYCRYLVARYGARPAVYLVGGDGSGYEPQVPAGGEEIEKWDAYQQPTGIHYRPHADNRAWQDADWLDFQWCQTGHSGEHMPERVTDMWRNTSIKAVANGEPTYEHGGRRGKAEGWWQGHEAWSNLCAGGTMGVVYGAGSLWQWRLHPEESGHEAFFLAENAGWREALDFEGSRYVGLIPRILEGLPTTDMEPNWQVSLGRRGLLVPGKLYIGYLSEGGMTMYFGNQVPRSYRLVDPRSGETVSEGKLPANDPVTMNIDKGPRVIICYKP